MLKVVRKLSRVHFQACQYVKIGGKASESCCARRITNVLWFSATASLQCHGDDQQQQLSDACMTVHDARIAQPVIIIR